MQSLQHQWKTLRGDMTVLNSGNKIMKSSELPHDLVRTKKLDVNVASDCDDRLLPGVDNSYHDLGSNRIIQS